MKIERGHFPDLCCGVDNKESGLPDRDLQQDEAKRYGQSYAHGTHQQPNNFR